MPNLLFLTQRIPYPPNKGEKIRAFQVLQHLRRSYDVHLGCLIDDPADAEHAETVRAMCKDAYFATLDRRWAKLLCLRGLLTGEALSVTFFADRGLAQWTNRVLDGIKPEAIVISSSNMAPYVLDHRHRGEVRVADLVDVDSEKWRAYAGKGGLAMRWVNRREWRRVAALERRIVRECDWSTVVSPEEARLLATVVPDRADHIRAISLGVDPDYFDPTRAYEPMFDRALPNFVFTGTMDYPPNVDAVQWFASAILPRIRKTLPQAKFHIVGANPTASVQALAQTRNGVFVTGRVPDVRPYTAHATACVAPMRIARGMQSKVLEAMAMARPVIVTPEALEGISAEPGMEIVCARGEEAFAAAAVELATQPGGTEIGARARVRVLTDYIAAARMRGFDELLRPLPRG